jgi:hypothetical protein
VRARYVMLALPGSSPPGQAGWLPSRELAAIRPGDVVANRCGGGAPRLALGLVLEAGQELRADVLTPPSSWRPAGCGTRVVGRRHRVTHVQRDDLGDPGGPLRRPAGRRRPRLAALRPPRTAAGVERLRQPDVVEQRRDVVQLFVEGDAVRCAVHRGPACARPAFRHRAGTHPAAGGGTRKAGDDGAVSIRGARTTERD